MRSGHSMSRIGRPLAIDIPPWTRDPQGLYMGGNNMALSPRAMLAIATTMYRDMEMRLWLGEVDAQMRELG